MSNALDEILLKHGADKGELRFSLKQDLYQLILTEVIGEDEDRYLPRNHNWKVEIDARNFFRAEMRQALAKLFNQESDDE